ncbi:histidine kinase [Microbacterium sp. Au-Mic1]|uniref:sensor histidine kinase n=1 Tax=Microbacterium sp. Au-Mic1 TaxID=2906457 RepID=UPI001E2B0751|nr:histidine kinase [Microbacterium sp. Au-Mic1]MCE4026152.1 histidine kinase [Microbacterium sp. Au-Mic1]
MTRINPLTWWSAGINLAGALAVGYGLWRAAPLVSPWVTALALIGLAAWVVRTLVAATRGGTDPVPTVGTPAPVAQAGESRASVPASLLAIGLLAAMTIAGSLTAVPTRGVGVALLVVAVMIVTSDPETPLPVFGGIAVAGALGIALGAVLAQAGATGKAGTEVDVLGFAGIVAALVLCVIAGLGRRAQRVLLVERERAGAEALRAQATAARVALARDLHDVLAHSLGGLVVQLDAAEALLDAGDAGRAAERVTAARRLAVEGLEEARDAVRALREPTEQPGSDAAEPVPPIELESRIRALVTGEKNARLDVVGVPRSVPAALAEALIRAVQEGLSNARKHAPGAEVRVGLVWHPDRVECTIDNPVPVAAVPDASLVATGGGYGLRGVRERFAALGGTARAGLEPGPSHAPRAEQGDRFVLRVEAPA